MNWLWSKREEDLAFYPSTLTKSNTDNSLPTERLTLSDSMNLFLLMEKYDLVFKMENGSYLLNKVEEYKWDEFVRELTRWRWTRHWVIKSVISILSFLIATFTGGLIGGLSASLITKIIE